MGYQFLHIEGYARKGSQQIGKARKWSAAEVAAEAMRDPHACPHVLSPRPPNVLHGCSPREAVQIAEKWAESSKDAMGRKLRSDGLVLAAGVISLPNEQQQDWPRFREAAVHWLKQQYGERLRSVIEHIDEAHPHLHFYAVPLAGERFEAIQKGRQASFDAKAMGKPKGAQNESYKAAMRLWQDDFSKSVAANFGLARLGPAKRRLTRGQWQAEQKQAKSLANTRIKHSAIALKPEEVKRKVIKQSLLKTEYESDPVFANRITEIVQEKIGPVTSIAAKAAFHSEQSQRLQTSLDELQKKSEKTKQLLDEANSTLSLFSDEQIAAAKAAKNALDRDEFEHTQKLIEQQKKQEQLNAISVERQRRIEAFPRLLNSAVGAARTFIEHALEALKKMRDPSQIKWEHIEGNAATESMRDHGQVPDDVARAICELSPLRVTETSHRAVYQFCEENGAKYIAEFKRSRGNESGNELR